MKKSSIQFWSYLKVFSKWDRMASWVSQLVYCQYRKRSLTFHEGSLLETLDFAFYICSTPNFYSQFSTHFFFPPHSLGPIHKSIHAIFLLSAGKRPHGTLRCPGGHDSRGHPDERRSLMQLLRGAPGHALPHVWRCVRLRHVLGLLADVGHGRALLRQASLPRHRHSNVR